MGIPGASSKLSPPNSLNTIMSPPSQPRVKPLVPSSFVSIWVSKVFPTLRLVKSWWWFAQLSLSSHIEELFWALVI